MWWSGGGGSPSKSFNFEEGTEFEDETGTVTNQEESGGPHNGINSKEGKKDSSGGGGYLKSLHVRARGQWAQGHKVTHRGRLG